MNHEIYNKFQSPDTVTVIKVRRLEKLGHVVRMDVQTQYRSNRKANQKEEQKKKEDLD
jgi:hypothetical protein